MNKNLKSQIAYTVLSGNSLNNRVLISSNLTMQGKLLCLPIDRMAKANTCPSPIPQRSNQPRHGTHTSTQHPPTHYDEMQSHHHGRRSHPNDTAPHIDSGQPCTSHHISAAGCTHTPCLNQLPHQRSMAEHTPGTRHVPAGPSTELNKYVHFSFLIRN